MKSILFLLTFFLLSTADTLYTITGTPDGNQWNTSSYFQTTGDDLRLADGVASYGSANWLLAANTQTSSSTAQITSVQLVGTLSGPTTLYFAIKTHGTLYTSKVIVPGTYPIFTKHSYTWSTNPFTSSLWTWGEINHLLIGVRNSPMTGLRYVDQIYVVVSVQ